MGAPLHSRTASTARAAIDEIQAAVGIVALLHAGDVLDDADMAAAVRCIEAQLIILGGAIDVAVAPEDERLPILTLAEVAARFGHRRTTSLKLVGGMDA